MLPGFGGTARLASRLGEGQACRFTLSGEMVSAQYAKELGWIDEVAADGELEQQLAAFAKRHAKSSPSAMREIKKLRLLALEEALRSEREAFAACFDQGDQAEGMRAFMEKRSPSWEI